MRDISKLAMWRPSLFVAFVAAIFAVQARAGIVQGKISDTGGKPVTGAIVTLTSKQGVGESVYTDTSGGYRLDTGLAGDLNLRVRKRYYRDDSREVALLPAAEMEIDVELTPLTDPQELSDAHPSLSHFSLIEFDEDETALFSRANFARDCLTCHSLGNSFTRGPRPAEFWVPSVQRMHGYLASADEAPIKARSEILAKAFNGRLATSHPEIPIDPLLFGATVHQWRLDGTVVPHDAEYSESNGLIYSSDMFAGEVLETNLETGETLHFALPADGEPAGGTFTRMGLPAPYGLTVARAPHSLVVAPDGMIYLTDSIGAAVTSFDPATRKFENFEVEDGALYPHTVRMDGEGVVWFTIAFSNQVGRFDPKTKSMKVITLPNPPR